MAVSDNFWPIIDFDYLRPGRGPASLSSWTVSAIVAEICLRAGLPYDRINLQLLEGQVEGVPYSPEDAAFTVLEALGQIFLFDASNFDGQLNFAPRGLAAVADLSLEDLIDDGGEGRKTVRRDSLTVPKTLHLEYFDVEGGLSPDKQTSDRSLDARAVSETVVATAVLLHADDAAKSAVINHKIAIEEQRGEQHFSLPEEFIWLTPGDAITLEHERLRIIEIDLDDGVQNYRATFDRASAYGSTIKGVPIQEPIDPPSLIIGETVFHFIDSHILRDADDRFGFYAAIAGTTPTWQGALVELSVDGGETYIESVDAFTDADMGELAAPLPSHPVWYPDERNALAVSFLREEMAPEATTLAGMMNRQNLALVGDEIINFADADEIEPGRWELRYLLRGRKGSPIAEWPAGTRFVSLDRNQLWFIDAELFMQDRPLTFRATSFGTAEGVVSTVVFTGRSQTERRPAYLTAYRREGQLHISWQGVGRLGGGARVAMGQHFTGYRLTVGGTVINTQNMQHSMPEPPPDSRVRVQQLNELTGPGPAIEVIV